HDGHFFRAVHETSWSWTYQGPDTMRYVASQRCLGQTRRRGEATGLESCAQLDPVRAALVRGPNGAGGGHADFEFRHRWFTFLDSCTAGYCRHVARQPLPVAPTTTGTLSHHVAHTNRVR